MRGERTSNERGVRRLRGLRTGGCPHARGVATARGGYSDPEGELR